MQDIYTIGVGSGGRFFSGGGGGDRRLRPHHHQGLGGQSPKCPRCDSANTKFCYYNNYNLSQPRHFCKSCRRYWTKGGVLRNVPVGGGCRKTKRNSSSTTAKPKSSPKSNGSNSSSEANPSFKPMTSSSAPINPTFDPMTSSPDSGKRSFAPVMSSSGPSPGGDVFSGSFTSMMTSSSDPLMELDFGGDQSLGRQQWTRKQGNITSDEPATTTMPDELKTSVGFLDPMAQMDLSGRDQDGLGAMDHELFDLYWTQPPWNNNDHALYLP